MKLTSSTGSWNAALGRPVTLDAGESFDPEGGALTNAWSVSPTDGVSLAEPDPSRRTAVFLTPGLYAITASGTDPAGQAGSITREIMAYNASDFESFGSTLLSPVWTAQAVELRDSYSPAAWYSLEAVPGQCLIHVTDAAVQPLSFDAPTFPALWRALPPGPNAVLATEFDFDSKRTGASFAGLVMDGLENGAPVRYVFGVESGTTWRVKRSAGGAFTNVGSGVPFTGTEAVLRIRAHAGGLSFERRAEGVWTVVASQAQPAGSSLVRGGVFASTSSAENVRFAFDYALVVDPGNTNSQLNNLRLTEIMYAPKAPDTAEWIELQNTGEGPVSLQGLQFPQGAPFDEFVLGEASLAAGERVVVTGNLAAFRARYGPGPRVVAEWPGGALNNAGESVTVFDADGNTIHSFAYGVTAPWPVAPRGDGPSLEVIDVDADYNDPANWRASSLAGGSPGSDGSVVPNADTDGDGLTDAAEALFGTDPADPRSVAAITLAGPNQFEFPSVAGNKYALQANNDLSTGNWETVATVTAVGPVTVLSDPTDDLPSARFYRIEGLAP